MFQPPANNYDDHYDQAKFKLTWNMNLMLVIILLIITEVFIFVEPRFVLHYGLGVVLTGASLLYMRSKRRFEPTVIISSVLGFILVSSSIFFVDDAPHFIEPFWLLNITFFVFFVLGLKWGIGFLIAQIIVVGIYLATLFQSNLESVRDFAPMRFASMAIEFSVCMLLLGYIISQFVQSNRYAERKYKESNELLLSEKNNVDQQNKEKTVMLQEIHHRVKNNLQVVTSLLRLQSSKVSSEESRLNFQDAINRIMTMALIHQKMYEEENLADIDLKDYFGSLLSDLVQSNASNIEFNFEVDIAINKIGNKSIVPLALIITELVTNSIKHGFIGKEKGTIGLSLNQLKDENFEMIYFDNGEWKPREDENSLGLDLIDAFTEQLEGKFNFERSEDHSTYNFVLKQIEGL